MRIDYRIEAGATNSVYIMMRDIKFGNGTGSVGVVKGTESSLIETSITVPIVNAAFYVCVRGTIVSCCHRLLLFSYQGIHFNYKLDRLLLVSTDLNNVE